MFREKIADEDITTEEISLLSLALMANMEYTSTTISSTYDDITATIIDPQSELNYTIFPLIITAQIARTKSTMAEIYQEPDITGATALEAARIYIDKVETMIQYAQSPDERAIFAFQRFYEVSNTYYTEALNLLNGILTDSSISERERAEALTLQFVTHKKMWNYDSQKESFNALSQVYKSTDTDNQILIRDTLAQYFAQDILSLNHIWKPDPTEAQPENLNEEQRTMLYITIEEALNNPAEYSNNQLSLIPYREEYLQQEPVLNLLDPETAGKVGYYVSRLILRGESPDEIISLLCDMIRYKPLLDRAREIKGRTSDLWNNEDDIADLSLIVDLKDLGKTDAEIIEMLTKEEQPANLDIQENTVSDETEEEIARVLYVIDFLSNRGEAAETFTTGALTGLGFNLASEEENNPVSEWSQLLIDLLTRDNITDYRLRRIVEHLDYLEPLDIEGNEMFDAPISQGTETDPNYTNNNYYRYSGSYYYEERDKLNLMDEMTRHYIDFAYQVREQLADIITFDLEEESNQLILINLTKVMLNKSGDFYDRSILQGLGAITEAVGANSFNTEEREYILSILIPEYLYGKNTEEIAGLTISEVTQLIENYKTIKTNLTNIPNPQIKELTACSLALLNISTEETTEFYQTARSSYQGLKEEYGVSTDAWAGIVLPAAKRILGDEYESASEDEIREILDILHITNLGSTEGVSNLLEEVRIASEFNQYITYIKEEGPAFLEKYVLGEKYDGSIDAHQQAYQEWIGYYIPEVMESMHSLLELDYNKDTDFIYNLARSVDEDVIVLSSPETEIVQRRELLNPIVQYLYGTTDLSETYRVGSEEDISSGNYAYRSLLGYYAGLTEENGDYIPVSLISATLLLEKILVRDASLEELYGAHFNLITGIPTISGEPIDGAIDVTGVAGFYVKTMEEWAGIGFLDCIISCLLQDSSRDEALIFIEDKIAPAITDFLSCPSGERIMPNIEGIPQNITEQFGKWIENIEKKYINTLTELNEQNIKTILTQDILAIIHQSTTTAFDLKIALDSNDRTTTENILSKLFNIEGTPELTMDLRRILEMEYDPQDPIEGFSSLSLIAQIAQLSTVVNPEGGRFSVNGRAGLSKEIEILNQIRIAVESEIVDLNILGRADSIWIISGLAAPIIYGAKTVAETIEDIQDNAKALRLLQPLLINDLTTSETIEILSDPTSILSDATMAGLLSSVGEQLNDPSFNIVESVNRDYILALLGEEREFILQLKSDIQGLAELNILLSYGKPEGYTIDFGVNLTNAGYLEATTQETWQHIQELKENYGLSEEEAKTQALTSLKENLKLTVQVLNTFGVGETMEAIGQPEGNYTIEDILQNSDAIGLLSYYAKLIAPITDREIKEFTEDPHFEQIKRIIADMQIGRISGEIPNYNYLQSFPLPRSDDDLARMIIFWERYTGKEFTMAEMPEGTLYFSHIEDYKNSGTDAVTFNYIELEAIRFIRNVCGVYNSWIKASVLGESADANEAWQNFVFTLIKVSNALEPQAAISLEQDSVLLSNFDQAGFLTNQSENAMQIGLNTYLEIARSSDPYENSFNGFLNNKGIDGKDISNIERLKLQIEFEATEEGSSLLWGGISDEELKASDAYMRNLRNQPEYQELIVEYLEGQGLTAYIKNGQLYIQSYTVEGSYVPPYETAIDPEVAKEIWFDWMLTNGFDPLSPTDEQYAKLEEFKGQTVTVGGGPTIIRVHPKRNEYYATFEEAYKEQLEGLFSKSVLELAIDYGVKIVSDRLAIAAELKPLVEQARFMDIDMLDPYQSGIVFYYVAQARIYGLDKVKEILNAEIAARVTLDDYKLDYNNPNAVGLLGWFANEPEVTLSMVRGEAAKKACISGSGVSRGYQIPTEETLLEDVRDLLIQNGAENIDTTFVASFLNIYDPNWTSWLRDIEGKTYYLNQNTYRELADILTATSLIDRETLARYFGYSNIAELNRHLSSDLNGLRELTLLGQEIIARIDTGVDEWEEENLQPYKIQEAMKVYEKKRSEVLRRGHSPNTENILSTMNTVLSNVYRAYQNIVDGVISEMNGKLNVMALLREGHDTGSGALEDSSENSARILLINYGHIVVDNAARAIAQKQHPEYAPNSTEMKTAIEAIKTSLGDYLDSDEMKAEIKRVNKNIRTDEFEVAEGTPELRNYNYIVTATGNRDTEVQEEFNLAQTVAIEITTPQIANIPASANLEQILIEVWGLNGDRLDSTLIWFNDTGVNGGEGMISRILSDYFKFSTTKRPYIERALTRAAIEIANLTEGEFSFWMMRDTSVRYPRFLTMYPGAEGKCLEIHGEFIQSFMGYFTRELEGEMKRDPDNIENNFEAMLDRAAVAAWEKHGYWTDKNTSDARSISFNQAVDEIAATFEEIDLTPNPPPTTTASRNIPSPSADSSVVEAPELSPENIEILKEALRELYESAGQPFPLNELALTQSMQGDGTVERPKDLTRDIQEKPIVVSRAPEEIPKPTRETIPPAPQTEEAVPVEKQTLYEIVTLNITIPEAAVVDEESGELTVTVISEDPIIPINIAITTEGSAIEEPITYNITTVDDEGVLVDEKRKHSSSIYLFEPVDAAENTYSVDIEAIISNEVVAEDSITFKVQPIEAKPVAILKPPIPAVTIKTPLHQAIIDIIPDATINTIYFSEDLYAKFETNIAIVNSSFTEEEVAESALLATTMVVKELKELLPYIQIGEEENKFENTLFIAGYKFDYLGQYDFADSLLIGFVNGVLLNYSMLGWNRSVEEAMADCIKFTLNQKSLYGNTFREEIDLLKQQYNTR
ncbi:MAG: hypothetical protein P9L98_05755 [Candidatus Kaelpia imicola]|nr:hypothetical protein [Candidatus Kaelpia imicola]